MEYEATYITGEQFHSKIRIFDLIRLRIRGL
jgi:hypothetical protein